MTPGWNDPPLLSQQSANPRSRTLLNKRVAYPLSKPTSVESSQMLPPANLMPLPATLQIPKATDTNESKDNCDLNSLTKVLDIFNNLVNDIPADIKKSEISKRVTIMKTMWEENKLTAQVHNDVLKLAECLKAGEIDKANEIYASVSVNSAALCSPWLLGIKYIIHHCKSS
ncbi:hypothetical protein CBL_13227 [Carabus blaptoides fortunei]